MAQLFSSLVATLVRLFARFITAVRGIWDGVAPVDRQRIYYANHASHGDFILVWTVLPPPLRRRTRPVAGADYWLAGSLRSYLIRDVFNAVLVDRNSKTRSDDPVAVMSQALHGGDSLILFPEGTRNLGDTPLQPFKSGLYHLAQACPEVELVPTCCSMCGANCSGGAKLRPACRRPRLSRVSSAAWPAPPWWVLAWPG